MKSIFHFGAPCDPPIVNGFKFKESVEHVGYWMAEIEEEAVKLFEGIETFFSHPSEDPRLTAPAPEAPIQAVEGGMVLGAVVPKAEYDAVVAENAELKAQAGSLEAQITELQAQIEELQKALDEEEDAEIGDKAGDALKAEIDALEAKKAAGGLTKPEAMKLGKLKKKLEAAK